MSYIITDGTSYCHVTKTRAVEIVSERSQATEFASRLSAEKLLTRATKKLQGFQLVEVPEAGAAPAKRSTGRKGAKKQPKKNEETGKPGSKKTSESEKEQETSGEASAQEASGSAPSQAVQEEGTEAVPSKNRKRTHRGGRRRKSGGAGAEQAVAAETPAADAASGMIEEASQLPPENAATAEKPADVVSAAETKAEEPALSPAPAIPGFKVVVHNTASAKQAGAKKEAAKTAPVPETPVLKAETAAETAGEILPPAPESAKADAEADVTASSEDTQKGSGKSSSRNRRKNNRRKNRGERSEETEGAQAEASAETSAETSADANAAMPPAAEKPEAAESVIAETEAAAVPAEEEKPEEKKKAEPSAPVFSIPGFTVRTHHVSENAVAKPVRTASRPSAPAISAVKEPENQNAVSAAKAQQSPAADQADAPAAKDSRSSGRPQHDDASSRQQKSRGKQQKKMTASDVSLEEYEDIEFDAPAPKETARNSARRADGPKKHGQSDRREDTAVQASSGKSTAAAPAEEKAKSGSRSRSSSRKTKQPADESRRRMFTQEERNLIYNRTEGHCGICGKFIPLGEYTIDHIIPLSKGGTNDLDNLQACCGFCNKAKDDSMGEDFFRRIQNIFLYQLQLKYGKKPVKKLSKYMKELEDSEDEI